MGKLFEDNLVPHSLERRHEVVYTVQPKGEGAFGPLFACV